MTGEVIATLVWIGVAVVLFLVEACTVQMVAVWLAIGCLAAAVPAYFGLPFWAQFVCFTVVSAILLAATRPLAKKLQGTRKEKTNLDRVVGQMGVVLEATSPLEPGRVRAMGLDWSAVTPDGSPLLQGQQVQVQRIDGVKLVVTPASQERTAPVQPKAPGQD